MNERTPLTAPVAHLQSRHSLSSIPPEVFTWVVKLYNHCSDVAKLHGWIDTIHHYRMLETNASISRFDMLTHWAKDETIPTGTRGGTCGADGSQRSQQRIDSPISTARTPNDTGYTCHVCGSQVRHYRDFYRHLNQICMKSRCWRCPDLDCGREFPRRYRFREHHQNVHPCGKDDCNHEETAKQLSRPRIEFGCGYCLHLCPDFGTFWRHLAGHFPSQPTWNVSTHFQSVLLNPAVRQAWERINTTRFGTIKASWPNITWESPSAISVAEEHIATLERGIQGRELDTCLRELLNSALADAAQVTWTLSSIRDQHYDQSHQASTFTTNLFETHSNDTISYGNLDTMVDTSSLKSESLASISPSTLLNAENFGDAKSSLLNYFDDSRGGMEEANDSTCHDPVFDFSFDNAIYSQDPNIIPKSKNCSMLDVNMEGFDSTAIASDVSATATHDVQDIACNGCSYDSSNATNTEHLPRLEINDVHPRDTILDSDNISWNESRYLNPEPTPPFNAKPPLNQRKARKRSISRFFGLQSFQAAAHMPNFQY